MSTQGHAPIRVVVVDDHTLFREGVRLMLELESDLACVGQAEGVEDSWALVERTQPSLVLLDLRLADARGLDLLSRFATRSGAPSVLIVTAFPEEAVVAEAIRLGAKGVVSKDATRDMLLTAIRAVAAGRMRLPPELTEKVIAALTATAPATLADRFSQLTARERAIAALVGEGLKNRQIAVRLGVAEQCASPPEAEDPSLGLSCSACCSRARWRRRAPPTTSTVRSVTTRGPPPRR